MKASGICGSDRYPYHHGHFVVAGKKTGEGVIPGHEISGVVETLGKNVRDLREGDRVAIYLAIGCQRCNFCKSGNIVLCRNVALVGVNVNGGDAELLAVPERNCLLMPDKMSFIEGVLSTDAFGTLYDTAKMLGVSGEDTVAIYGMGPMGASGLLVCKALGATVFCVDALKERLSLAKDLGADEVINAHEEDPVRRIMDLTNSMGADKAIECSGSEVAETNALDYTTRRGKVAFVGESAEAKIRPSDQFLRKQLILFGSWYFNISHYDAIAKPIVNRAMGLERLVTYKFPLAQANEAFKIFERREAMKIAFTP